EQRVLVSIDGLVGAVELIEGQTQVEEPAGVVGIDCDSGAKLVQSLLPLVLLEKFLSALDASLGLVPVAHGLPPTAKANPARVLYCWRLRRIKHRMIRKVFKIPTRASVFAARAQIRYFSPCGNAR